jgi:hypothetical protein
MPLPQPDGNRLKILIEKGLLLDMFAFVIVFVLFGQQKFYAHD